MSNTPPAIPPAIRPEVLEAVARALCIADDENPDAPAGFNPHPTWHDYRESAKAAIDAFNLADRMPVFGSRES